MPKRGKNYRAALAKLDPTRRYDLEEAFGLVKEVSYAKFDAAIDVSLRLGVDPRKADQMVRGSVILPHGTGRVVRVAVFAKGDKANEAREAGADVVGAEDLAAKVKEGWLEFDKAIATPDMMGLVGPIGRILGPRGLMPNPKVGTVTFNVADAVRELKAGRVEYRTEKKGGLVQTVIGKASFSAQALRENFDALLDSVVRAKPSTAKGTYVKSITLSATMSPAVKVDPNVAISAARV
jgi:large subunit ribosomal protein L1